MIESSRDDVTEVRNCLFEALAPVIADLSLSGVSPEVLAASLIDVSASFSCMVLTRPGANPAVEEAMDRTASSFRALMGRYALIYTLRLDEVLPDRSGLPN